MTTLNDARFDALREEGFTGTGNDMLLQWYQSLGGDSGEINDAFYEMLIAQGISAGQINDMWYLTLGLLGYEGSLNDRELDFWIDGVGEFALPAAWYDETTLETVSGIGSQVTAWNNRGSIPIGNFVNATSPVEAISINNLLCSGYTGGNLETLIGLPFPQPFEGFAVIYISELQPLQIAVSSFNLGTPLFEVGVENGTLFMQTDFDGNSPLRLSIVAVLPGIYCIYIKLDGTESEIRVIDVLGNIRSVIGPLEPTITPLFGRLGNSADLANPIDMLLCELRFYITLDGLSTELIDRILTSLFNKWNIEPIISLNELGHDFSGPAGAFVQWNSTGSLDNNLTLNLGDVLDITQGTQNGLDTIVSAGGVQLFMDEAVLVDACTVFVIFQHSNPYAADEYILDGQEPFSTITDRIQWIRTDEGFLIVPAAGSGGESTPMGDPDDNLHILTYRRGAVEATALDIARLDGLVEVPVFGLSRWSMVSVFSHFLGDRTMVGQICEILVFDSPLSDRILELTEQFLMLKWDVTTAPIPENVLLNNSGDELLNNDLEYLTSEIVDFDAVLTAEFGTVPFDHTGFFFAAGTGTLVPDFSPVVGQVAQFMDFEGEGVINMTAAWQNGAIITIAGLGVFDTDDPGVVIGGNTYTWPDPFGFVDTVVYNINVEWKA